MKKPLLIVIVFFLFKTTCAAQSTEIKHIKSSLPNISDSTKYVDALNRLAMLLYEKNIDSTFYYTKKAREIANRIDYEHGKADALNNLGVFFDIKGNLQLALRYYDEAYIGYKKLKDSANCVQSHMNIGSVYQEMGRTDKSLQRFNEALNLGRNLRKDSIMSLVIYNYLLMFPDRLSRDSLGHYVGKARSIAKKHEDERVLIAIDQLIADDMIANGKRNEGMALLQRAIDTATEKKLYYVSMDMLIDAGDQLANTDPARAVAYYQRGLSTAGKNGYMLYSKLMARKLFDFYTARHDTVKAAAYSRQLVLLNDEQERMNSESAIDYLDYALKDEQVSSLTARSKYQTTLLVLSFIACVFAVGFIVAIRKTLQRTKRLNKQVISQNAQMKMTLGALEQSHADNSRMMKIVAHDLRNPIGAMYSIAGMLLDDPDRSEADRELLELIKASGQNSLDMVTDLLQVHIGAEELKKEPVDIGEMLHYCVSLLLNKAEAKGQHINLHTQNLTVDASREKLWRVISNLIANAIKFSPTGAAIDVNMEHDLGHVLIAVSDHGIGIPPEMHDKIFDMFTDAKRTGTAGEQPFGLGLAISKQIVEAHGGRIWFESGADNGTTFFVDLPMAN